MSAEPFVPEDFAVPDGLTAGEFRLTPLGPQHNQADYAAWTTSIDHIRQTPGFPDGTWPREISLDDNLRDLERHARDFAGRLRRGGWCDRRTSAMQAKRSTVTFQRSRKFNKPKR